MPSKQLTSQLSLADRRRVVDYFSDHPTVEKWLKLAEVVVGPVGFRLLDAVRAANNGYVKWPVIAENGDYEVPDHLQVCRGLRLAREFMKPKGSFFPTGGSPTAGGRPQGEVESGLQPVAISGRG